MDARHRPILWIALGAVAIGATLLFVVEPWSDPAANPPARSSSPASSASAPVVDASGSTSQESEAPAIVRTGDAELPAPVDLDAADRDHDLCGVVVDAAGAPVAGASVETVRYPGRRMTGLSMMDHRKRVDDVATRSAADGTFAVRLRRGALVTLRVRKPGFGTAGLANCQAGERVRIVLRAAGALEVVARDERGAPVSNVRVRAWRNDGIAYDEHEGVSDAEGRTTFADLATGPLTVACEHDVLGSPAWLKATIAEGATTRLEATLPDGEALHGTVLDAATAKPIEGARVGIGWTMARAVATDAAGAFLLPGWTGAREDEVHATADGYGRGAQTIKDAAPIELRLQRADEVRGRVLDHEGRPLPDARVTIIASGGWPQQIDSAGALAAADGTFRIGSLRRDMPHTLIVLPADSVVADGVPVAEGADRHGRWLIDFDPHPGEPGIIDLGDLVLPLPRAIEGVVLGAGDAPQAAVNVTLEGWNGDRTRLRPGDVLPAVDAYYGGQEKRRTDDLGRFRFPGQSPGEYVLRVDVPGRPAFSQPVHLPADADATDVVVRVTGGLDLLVRVVSESGLGLAGASVTAQNGIRADAKSDASGLAILHGLPDAEYDVYAYAGEGFECDRAKARPSPEEVRVVARAQALVSGIVVDESGHPLARMRVRFEAEDSVAFVETASDGVFRRMWRKGETLALFATDAPTADGVASPASWMARLDGVVAPATDLRLVARKVANDGVVTVSVVDPDGKPVAAAQVAYGPVFEEQGDVVVTDADGKVRIEGLRDVEYEVAAWPPTGGGDDAPVLLISRGVRVKPNGPPIVLALRASRRIRIEVRDPAGMPAKDARIRLTAPGPEHRSGGTDADGRAQILVPADVEWAVNAEWTTADGVILHADAQNVGAEVVLQLAR